MTRNYQEPCPYCGNALPKGPAKLARHYAKHPEIFGKRAEQSKDPDRKAFWVQRELDSELTETRATKTGMEQGAEAGQAALSDHSR